MSLPNLTEDEKRVIELLNNEPKSHFKNCFRSSLDHLERSYLVSDLDPAMAIFRAITAEEEAASGLMRCLIQLKYPLAECLQPQDHFQKHAVTPFLNALLLYFSNIKIPSIHKIKLAFKEIDGIDRIVTAFQLSAEGDQVWATPCPPLNLRVRQGEELVSPSFESDFKKIIQPQGFKNIENFIKSEANLRNRILYASKEGFPKIEDFQIGFIHERQKRVIKILMATLLISPYTENQPFVSQALEAYLQLIGKLKTELTTKISP